MTRYPAALWRPIPENDTQPTIVPTQIILHVSASKAESLYSWWTSAGVKVESHLHIGWKSVEQYLDFTVRADANYRANRRRDGTGAISVETAGLADGEWTDWQILQIINFIRWAHKHYRIPLRKARWEADPGIGWHIMFGAPGPWTPVAKVCPGWRRIEQIKRIIIPALKGREGMTDEQVLALLRDIKKDTAALRNAVKGGTAFGQVNMGATIAETLTLVQQLINRANTTDDQLRSITADITDTGSAVLGALSSIDTSGLTAEQVGELATAVAAEIAEHGLDLDHDRLFAALAARLTHTAQEAASAA